MSGIDGPLSSNQNPESNTAREVDRGKTIVGSTLSTGSQTQVVEATEVDSSNRSEPPTLKLRLKKSDACDEIEKGEKTKPKKLAKKQVSWTQETVDNENAGKKKSKCCCVYVKPKTFGESDTESDSEGDDDCKNCSGHTKSDPRKNIKS